MYNHVCQRRQSYWLGPVDDDDGMLLRDATPKSPKSIAWLLPIHAAGGEDLFVVLAWSASPTGRTKSLPRLSNHQLSEVALRHTFLDCE